MFLTVLLFFLQSSGKAQQPDKGQPSSSSETEKESPERASVNAILQKYEAGYILRRYESAYNHQNLEELLSVWPSAPNNKKQFQKIKDEFDRRVVSDMQVSMQASEVKALDNGDLLVHCTRTEQYKRLQSTSYSSGDLMMGANPVQNPGPSKLEQKKPFHDSREIWLTLHKTGTAWTIASLSEKGMH